MALKCDDPIRAAEKTARELRRGFFRVLFFRGILAALGVAAFVAGGAVLAVRFFAGPPRGYWYAGIAAAVLLAALLRGVLYARKHLPDSRLLLIWLDGASRNGGLLASSLETDPGAWRNSVMPPALPRVSVAAGRGPVILLAGMLFLAGALLFPESAISGRTHRTLDLTRETAGLEQKIEVLEEEALMPEKELADLKDGVAELKEKNDATNPARMFEMLDALSRRIGLAGEEVSSQLRRNSETMQMLSAALDTLGALPAERLSAEASSQMAELLKQLAADNPALAELLKQAGSAASSLDPETMKRLAEAMRDSSGQLEKQLSRLVESKLAKSRDAKSGNCRDGKCEGGNGGGNGQSGSPGVSPEAELAEWLAQNAPGADELNESMRMAMPSPAPGTGDATRGRGDAPLFFSGNTPGSGGKEVDLLLTGENDPARSLSVQQFASAPDSASEERRAAASGNLRGGDARIERSENRIYPAHRAAVERYFKPKGKRDTP